MGELTEVKKARKIKPWEGLGTAASKIMWAHGANSALATFLPFMVLWFSPVPTPEISPFFIVLSDFRNQAEKFSKGKVRYCCQNTKTTGISYRGHWI